VSIKPKKLILLTGGTRGIGNEILKKLFSEKKYLIAYTYNNKKNLAKKIDKELDDRQIVSFKCDLAKNKSIDVLLARIRKKFNKFPDIFIGNAGISDLQNFKKIGFNNLFKIFKINFFSNFYLSQKLITHMQKKKWGRIIFISSIGGQWGGIQQPHYAASKAALINLSKSLSKLYSKDGVLSNSIAVGLVKTDMSSRELSKINSSKLQIPMKRLGTKKEIAEFVAFLCSKQSSYLTGQTINLNGGMLG
jgi:NAD(P)-dependent dehydrogenase (short-subunit alcohol dehydrogenase family)